ncbi:hypothetical protein B5K08_15955 [Rhizobium leguminosarum bv. trifolii]|uniref:Uncharacterized protein n=1 Tax=Rhizobium leguminosarum bv. trifolii TaxID=386 RepID=A0A3E1BGS3_RHILT|nr:hypothetical protein [Rhizobium leguminosarum]RFB91788.1 hypothetical protein B5K08_15955 [Rhizobium leguminosarum bv. trifolii]RFB92305.1 hypothetical protein B5K10_15950 [Rhizobium leguminosarum bv. trifolii]
MKSKREKIAWAAVVVATFGICLPIMFGEPRKIDDQHGGDGWRNAIYDFQTLITGVAAVVAAYFAINQSRMVEANSERRHQQLMELSLRSARLMINRTVFPMVEYIEEALENVEGWHKRIAADGGAWFLAKNFIHLKKMSGSWQEIVYDEQLGIAEAYFDGAMVHALRRSRETTKSITGRVITIEYRLTPLTGYDGEQEVITGVLQEFVDGLDQDLRTLLEFLTEFRDGLRKLERDYLKTV